MSKLQTIKLSDMFTLQMGKTPSRDNPAYWNGTHKWVSIADLGKATKFIVDTKECITDLAVSETGIRATPKDTVVMSFKLSIGKTAVTAEEIYTNEAIMSFVDKGIYDFDIDYIYHLFSGKDWSEGTNKAVMGVTLNKATLSQISIPLPPIEEQRKIAHNLEKVTYLIEVCNTILEKLDLLVKSRFVEMFGDTEVNSNNHPVHKLSDLCTVSSSKRIYQEEQSSSGVPFLRISNLVELIDNGKFGSDLFIPEEKYNELFTNGLVPKADDILVTSRGTLGKCYIIQEHDKFYFQDGMISWLYDIDKSITPLYLTLLFDTRDIKRQIDNLQSGSTVAYLSIAMLKKLNIVVPPLALQEQFAAFVEQTDKSKLAVKQVLEKAETLKKALMQEYFG